MVATMAHLSSSSTRRPRRILFIKSYCYCDGFSFPRWLPPLLLLTIMGNRSSFGGAFSNIPKLDQKRNNHNNNEIRHDDFLIRRQHFQQQQLPVTLRVSPKSGRMTTTMMVAQSNYEQNQDKDHDGTWKEQNDQPSFNNEKRETSGAINHHDDEPDILQNLHRSVDSWSMKMIIAWMTWIMLLLTMVIVQTTTIHWEENNAHILLSLQESQQIPFVVSAISTISALWCGILIISWRKTMMDVITNALVIQQAWDKGHYEWGSIFSECRHIARHFATKFRYYHDYDKYHHNKDGPTGQRIQTIANDNDDQQQQQQQKLLLRQLADALWSFPKSVEFHLQQRSLGVKNNENDERETNSDDEMTREEAAAATFAEQVQLVLSEDVSSSTLLVQDLIGAQDKPNRSLEEIIYIVDALMPLMQKQQQQQQQQRNSRWKPKRNSEVNRSETEYRQVPNYTHDVIISNAISSLGNAVTSCEESVQTIYHHSRSFEVASEDATQWSKKVMVSLFLLSSISLFPFYSLVDWFPLESLTYKSGSSMMMTAIPILFTMTTIMYSSSFVVLLTVILEQLTMQTKVPRRSFFASIQAPDETSAIERKADFEVWKEFAKELHGSVDVSSQQTEQTEDTWNRNKNMPAATAMIPSASSEKALASTAGLSSFIIPRSDLSDDIVTAAANNNDPSLIKPPMEAKNLRGHSSSISRTRRSSNSSSSSNNNNNKNYYNQAGLLFSGSGTFTIPRSEAVALSELLDTTNASTNMTVNGHVSFPKEGALMARYADVNENCPQVPTTSSFDAAVQEKIESFSDGSLEDFLKNQGKREI